MQGRAARFSHRLGAALAILAAAALVSCERSPKGGPQARPASRFSQAAPPGREADDVGRFLSGLNGNPGSVFAGLEAKECWRAHRGELDAVWKKVESRWLPAMRRFQGAELSGAPLDNAALFYPFSGPDILMAAVFFPHSPVYVMVGLEPAGTLPTPKQIAREDLSRYLAEVRESVSSELERSFFITREMDREFRGQVTDGLLPPILLLLARTGHTVLGHRYVRLDAEGRIVERAAGYRAPGRTGNLGVEIDFRGRAGTPAHKLFYFSVNLSDKRLQENKPFLAFLEGLEGMVTFFKATSYMPHGRGFSMIRGRVLAGSAAILQDDSGIPYRFFDATRWNIQLYGDYTRPYGSFRWLEQPDLRKAYADSMPKTLEFRIGYGFARVPSNLLLARRRPASTSRQ